MFFYVQYVRVFFGYNMDHATYSSCFMQLLYGKPPSSLNIGFKGKAEVNHYKLEQNRYGEMRKGHAVCFCDRRLFTSKTSEG